MRPRAAIELGRALHDNAASARQAVEKRRSDETVAARAMRVRIPWPPGGSNDVVGRIVLQKMSESLGQQFVVDNRPGAAGSIGSDVVAKAPPDGYTLMVHSTTHVGNAH